MAQVTPAQIAAWAKARGLDPQAVLAVAAQEGLSGGIGDSGHAFGPFQLNDAGGVITGKFPGWGQDQIQQWAWSPQGVNYALGGIQNAAGGLTGAPAVHAIVYGFERPLDKAGEEARALRAYGGGIPAAPSIATAPAAAALAPTAATPTPAPAAAPAPAPAPKPRPLPPAVLQALAILRS